MDLKLKGCNINFFNKINSTIEVKVLQNGIVVGNCSSKLNKVKKIFLSGKKNSLISSLFADFDKKTILGEVKKDKFNITLNDIEGYILKSGEFIGFNKGEATNLILAKDDVANILYKNFTILIKILTKQKKAKQPLDLSYRNSIFTSFFKSKKEVKVFIFTLILSASISSLVYFPLLMVNEKTSLARFDLSDEFILPYMNTSLIKLAPEYLHQNLDRKEPISSIINYNKDYIEMMSSSVPSNSKYMYGALSKYYSKINLANKAAIENEINKQLIFVNKKVPNIKTYIKVPVIAKQNIDSEILNIIEKRHLDTLATKINLEEKRKFNKKFKEEAIYNPEEYKNLKPQSKEVQEFLEGVKVFDRLTNEETMYKEFDDMALKAIVLKHQLNKNNTKTYLNKDNFKYLTVSVQDNKYIFVESNLDSSINKLMNTKAKTKAVKTKKSFTKEKAVRIKSGVVERIIVKHQYQITLCYKNALKKNKKLYGNMEWMFSILKNGKTSKIKLTKSDFTDIRLNKCIIRKIATWKFPSPGAKEIEIRYPIAFKKR